MRPTTGVGGSRPDPTVRTRVLRAFTELVADKGLTQTSVDDVAAAAGVSKTTLYTRWPDRRSLIIDGFGFTAAAIPPEPDDVDDPSERFHRRLDAILDASSDDDVQFLRHQLLADLIAAAGVDDELRDVLLEHRRHWETALHELIELGKLAGEIPADRDTDVAVEVVIAVIPMRQLLGLPIGPPLHALVRRLLTEDRPY